MDTPPQDAEIVRLRKMNAILLKALKDCWDYPGMMGEIIEDAINQAEENEPPKST